MATPELPYTVPRLVKGKKIEFVPKGSTKANEEAKQKIHRCLDHAGY